MGRSRKSRVNRSSRHGEIYAFYMSLSSHLPPSPNLTNRDGVQGPSSLDLFHWEMPGIVQPPKLKRKLQSSNWHLQAEERKRHYSAHRMSLLGGTSSLAANTISSLSMTLPLCSSTNEWMFSFSGQRLPTKSPRSNHTLSLSMRW